MKTLMIYGATGYTGRMISTLVKAAGLKLILGGRNASTLAELAATLEAEYRVFELNDDTVVDEALTGVSVILNCAGPFVRTSEILMKASIRNHLHYLDTSAELQTYRHAAALDLAARSGNVMLLPGAGGSVAMLGCLAACAVEKIKLPKKISLALSVAGPMSRGSAISAAESVSADCLKLDGGVLVTQDSTLMRQFDFGGGPVDCFPVTLPELVTVWRSTGAPDIETYVHLAGNGFSQGDLNDFPDGPSAQEREANRYQAVVEVTDEHGRTSGANLDSVNGYTFTALASAEAARRVILGEATPGFQTPADLFGARFAETIADTTIRLIA